MRRLLTLLFVTACAGITLSTASGGASGGHQYVVDGDFDQRGAWTVSPSAELALVDDGSSGGPYGRITLIGTSFAVRQRLGAALGPGEYALGVDTRTTDGVQLVAQVDFVSQPDATLRAEMDATASWREFDASSRINEASEAVLTLTGTGHPGDVIDIDNVQLVGPAPVSITPTPSATLEPTPAATFADATPVATPSAIALESISESLRNAGFETLAADGAVASWETFGGYASSASSPVRSGSRAARFESASDSTKWLHQSVLVRGGEYAEFASWIHHNDHNVVSVFLRVSWYASADASGSAIGTADSTARLDAPQNAYRLLTTGSIMAPFEARSATLRVMLDPASSARASIYVDDASFSPAVPPSPSPTVEVVVDSAAPAVASGSNATGTRSRTAPSRRGAGIGVSAGAAAAPGARVVINEVMYDPEGDETAGEWVELYNAGTEAASLEGWVLRDGSTADVLPAATLEPGEFAIVAGSGGGSGRAGGIFIPVKGRIGNGLGNDGDALVLVDPSGRVVDAMSWGDNAFINNPPSADVPQGHSLERIPVGTGDFVENPLPSPGVAAVASIAAPAQRRTVEILPADAAGGAKRLAWAAAAVSGTLLAIVVVWRTYELLRRRPTGA